MIESMCFLFFLKIDVRGCTYLYMNTVPGTMGSDRLYKYDTSKATVQ